LKQNFIQFFFQIKIEQTKKVVSASPFMIILCASALRCVHLQKDIASCIDLLKNGKLKWMHGFGKHRKLLEQAKLLAKQNVKLIFATPQRLVQLIDMTPADSLEPLQLNCLEHVVIDYSNRDVKQKRLVDIPEMKSELLKLFINYLIPLNKDEIKVKFSLI
jgi:hypothetical protein